MQALSSIEALTLAVGWILAGFLGLLGSAIIWKIARGSIDLSMLLCEESGKASLSRFLFLTFTFIYGMALVVVILSGEPPGFPSDIPLSAFALMGISAGSYLASKGIQTARDGNETIAETTQARAEAVSAMASPEFAASAQALASAAESLESQHLAESANALAQATNQLFAMNIAASPEHLAATMRDSSAAKDDREGQTGID